MICARELQPLNTLSPSPQFPRLEGRFTFVSFVQFRKAALERVVTLSGRVADTN